MESVYKTRVGEHNYKYVQEIFLLKSYIRWLIIMGNFFLKFECIETLLNQHLKEFIIAGGKGALAVSCICRICL